MRKLNLRQRRAMRDWVDHATPTHRIMTLIDFIDIAFPAVAGALFLVGLFAAVWAILQAAEMLLQGEIL